jgi:hypothetical protein
MDKESLGSRREGGGETSLFLDKIFFLPSSVTVKQASAQLAQG